MGLSKFGAHQKRPLFRSRANQKKDKCNQQCQVCRPERALAVLAALAGFVLKDFSQIPNVEKIQDPSFV